jgi:hypothetical protein
MGGAAQFIQAVERAGRCQRENLGTRRRHRRVVVGFGTALQANNATTQ